MSRLRPPVSSIPPLTRKARTVRNLSTVVGDLLEIEGLPEYVRGELSKYQEWALYLAPEQQDADMWATVAGILNAHMPKDHPVADQARRVFNGAEDPPAIVRSCAGCKPGTSEDELCGWCLLELNEERAGRALEAIVKEDGVRFDGDPIGPREIGALMVSRLVKGDGRELEKALAYAAQARSSERAGQEDGYMRGVRDGYRKAISALRDDADQSFEAGLSGAAVRCREVASLLDSWQERVLGDICAGRDENSDTQLDDSDLVFGLHEMLDECRREVVEAFSRFRLQRRNLERNEVES